MTLARTFGFALSLSILGCAGGPEDVGEAKLADTVCAAGATVEGIDVSEWQGAIDWQSVAGSGIGFAIARVSYGANQKDDYFDANWSGIQSAGLVRGVYQYFLPEQDAIAQADLLLDSIGSLGPSDLPPVIDVEHTGGQSAATIASKVSAWVNHVEAATGRKPIIYTGKYFWQDYVASDAFGDYPLWIPNYSFACPNLPNGYWSDWMFFQYTDSGSVPGVAGNVDRNLFNGTLQDLKAFANSAPAYAAEFVSQSFPYASEAPVQIVAGGTLDAYIELKNVGTATWDASTRLGTTEPRDRESVFAGPEWPGPNRYAQVTGTVPPGGTYKFTFTLHAPQKPGLHDEHFGVVQEGVTWFSDPGQGGPPDPQLEGIFEVIAAPGSGSGGAGGGNGNGGDGGNGNGGTPAQNKNGEVNADGGCAVRPATAAENPGAALLLAGIVAMAARRRRQIAAA